MKTKVALLVALLALAIVPVAKADFRAPPTGYWRYCGQHIWGWKGTAHYTSCPFALNVGRAVRRSPDFGMHLLRGRIYSPVTHLTYVVNCVRRPYYVYRCTAGLEAVIWVG